MLVAVSATGPSLNDEVDPHFGRCPYFVLVDFDTMEVEALPNPNAGVGGEKKGKKKGEVSAAQMIIDKGVQMVLTGKCGPKAFKLLLAANVKVVPAVKGKVGGVIRSYKPEPFQPVSYRVLGSSYRTGGEMGAGAMPPRIPPQPAKPKPDLEELKAQSKKLAQQLAKIQRHIEEAEKKGG
jgi:predicted Fe-Mo cluster-binding NifX family protein